MTTITKTLQLETEVNVGYWILKSVTLDLETNIGYINYVGYLSADAYGRGADQIVSRQATIDLTGVTEMDDLLPQFAQVVDDHLDE